MAQLKGVLAAVTITILSMNGCYRIPQGSVKINPKLTAEDTSSSPRPPKVSEGGSRFY
ncbi:MAG: hypothetical protein ACRC8A_16765 [Microcoleaceae cyanobacterium]